MINVHDKSTIIALVHNNNSICSLKSVTDFVVWLINLWGTDTLFEKLRPETEGWIRKTPFALCLLG